MPEQKHIILTPEMQQLMYNAFKSLELDTAAMILSLIRIDECCKIGRELLKPDQK